MLGPAARLSCLLLLTASCASTPGPEPEGYRWGTTVYIGKAYFDDDWDPIDNGDGGGFAVDWGPADAGWRVEAGFNDVKDHSNVDTSGFGVDQVRFDARILEGYLGVRQEFMLWERRIRPYVGGGLSYAKADLESSPPPGVPRYKEDDDTFGIYAHAGVKFPVTDHMEVGVDYRTLLGTEFDFDSDTNGSDIDGKDLSGQYDQITFTLSWTF